MLRPRRAPPGGVESDVVVEDVLVGKRRRRALHNGVNTRGGRKHEETKNYFFRPSMISLKAATGRMTSVSFSSFGA